MYGEDIRAAPRIGERESDHHLAAHRRIGRLEFECFDHLLIWNERKPPFASVERGTSLWESPPDVREKRPFHGLATRQITDASMR